MGAHSGEGGHGVDLSLSLELEAPGQVWNWEEEMVQGAGDGLGHVCSYALRVSGAMCGI